MQGGSEDKTCNVQRVSGETTCEGSAVRDVQWVSRRGRARDKRCEDVRGSAGRGTCKGFIGERRAWDQRGEGVQSVSG